GNEPLGELHGSTRVTYRRVPRPAQRQSTTQDRVSNQQLLASIVVLRILGGQSRFDALIVAIRGYRLRQLSLFQCDLTEIVICVSQFRLPTHVLWFPCRERFKSLLHETVQGFGLCQFSARLENAARIGACRRKIGGQFRVLWPPCCIPF